MEAAGATLVGSFAGLSVTGLTEVIRIIPRSYAMYRRLVAAALARRPDVFVAIDFSGFNFHLIAAMRRLGVPVVYYVCPQLWAWRPRRMADLGGPALKKAAEGYGWNVLAESLVPDEKRDIQRAVRELINKGCALVLTTGGTGVALRDVTPEAVREMAVRELPGFGEVMRMESLKITKNAILSRNLAAVVDRALVLCLPGKPSGAVECLGFVVDAIPHCVEVLQEVPTSC
jgi:molybdopterin adenylyltransferase